MNRPLLPLIAAVLLLFTGCGHLDLTPEGNPNRVVTGTVNVRMNLLPPPDSELIVRLLQPADVTATPTDAGQDLVIGQRGTREQPAQVVAEQVIHAPARMPVAFHLAYHASDERLRRGLNIEARMSWGGHVRLRTIDAQALTLENADAPQTLWLQPVN